VILAESATDRAGTGTHRRFSRDEAIIACIVHAFASHQIAIGQLIEISKAARSGIGKRIVDAAIAGDESWLLMYQSWKGGNVVNLFRGQPEFTHLRKPDGFAVIICLKNYVSKIDA
jgi:hypothetical protein